MDIREEVHRFPIHPPQGDHDADTEKEASTFLTHLLDRTLVDERYAVERFKYTARGEIRSALATEGGKQKTRRATASRKAVREMQPA